MNGQRDSFSCLRGLGLEGKAVTSAKWEVPPTTWRNSLLPQLPLHKSVVIWILEVPPNSGGHPPLRF